jgi:16S rRNA (cytidine1402-2'-O)-methyltransferase
MRGEHREAGEGRGRLYVVATPIGNLADITLRALDVLRNADVVCAEDTRTTGKLLRHHGIDARLKAVHAHNEARAAGEITALLAAGRDVALVTDAGTPGISDPGALIVAAVRDAGFEVVPIPGASALAAALSVSGLHGPFAFIAFLPARAAARRSALAHWRDFPHALVFYEAPHRIVDCVADLAQVLGESRRIVIGRELTKLYESVHECALGEARAWLEADADRQRGEFVLIVSGAAPRDEAVSAEARRVLAALLAEMPVKSAVRLAAEITGAPRNALYAIALEGRADVKP